MVQSLAPAQLIASILQRAERSQHAELLQRAQVANQRMLQALEDERLHQEETGWLDHWNSRYQRTTETLAEIQRALATC
jgi:hypothetical protein